MSAKARILVVDDEHSMREFLQIFFQREGYEVLTAGDVGTALMAVEADDFDVVITDMQMPDRTGLELLSEIKDVSPETLVVVITAFATTETAIQAMKQGAYDYVTKPFKVDELRLVIEKALEKKLLTTENRRLRTELRDKARNRHLIGNSDAMAEVYELIAQVAMTRTNVLVSGESGTGKELVARAVHEQSERASGAFVAINCGAIPENLLESELFGHVKGAFTGAVENKAGLFEAADGGTLFLDEIGELPQSLQVKLLRAIQDKTVRRVGGTSDRRVDARIIAATNRRLEDEVAAGRFREDLYYRLNVIEIPLPALRDRTDDIPLLMQHFGEKYAAELDRPGVTFTEEALGCLLRYRFPGNVRELENVVERAVALSSGEPVGIDSLPANLSAAPEKPELDLVPAEGETLNTMVDEFERKILREALRRSGGVKKRAAQFLGISFRSFRYRLEKLGLEDGEA